MNIKEAIAEIEKRYKVGDEIPCLASGIDYIEYDSVDSFSELAITKYDSWGVFDVYVKTSQEQYKICSKGKWSEPIREEKNLWNFFKSIEDTYTDVVEKYLRNLTYSFTNKGNNSMLISLFDWRTTKEGVDYWENINELYHDYLNN